METLVDLLHDAAQRYGDRPALTAHEGLRWRAWSYRQLRDGANALARHFRHERNLAPGTPVVFWEQNSPELVTAILGAMAARLVVIPIDPSATPEFVARVVSRTGARLIVSPSADVSSLGVCSVAVAGLPFGGDDRPLPDAPTPDEVAEVVFTSGTTGEPKGVVLLHRNITANVDAVVELVPNRPFRLISLLPLSHMFEQTVGLYAALKIGSTIHYPSSRRAPVVAKAMRRNKISAVVAVPQVLELLMHGIERAVDRRGQVRRWEAAHRIAPALPLRARRVLFRTMHRSLGGHLDFVMCGGAHLPPELAEAWERMGVRVVEGYGTTECAPVVAANTYWDRHPGSVGRPLEGVEVDLSTDGEILVRGPNVFARYWDAPEATAAVIDEHGWYRTGDLGSRDDDGHLRITGRRSDRIVLASGLNVYPEDVERELRQEPEIADGVVVSIPDAAGRPRLWAVVIPENGGGPTAVERVALEQAVSRASVRLAPHQRPAGLTIWTRGDFPRTNLLKVKRYEVEEAVHDGAVEIRPAPRPGEGEPDDREVVDRVRRLLVTVGHVDRDRIHGKTDLTLDLGLDSLTMLELAAALEDELGVIVDDGDLVEVGSVDDLCDLIERSASRLPEQPPPAWPQSRWARWLRAGLQTTLLFPVHGLVARPFVVEGRDALDGVAGPVLIVANHCSHADTPSILRALPGKVRRRTMVAAAADYFYRSTLIGGSTSLVLATFPFSREGAVRSSLERCGELTDDGWSLLIYPEGTRSTTGEIAPFRRGIGLLATQLGVPVVPIGIVGTHDVWPKGRRLPTPGPVTVRIGRPIDVGLDTNPDEAAKRLESAVAALTRAGHGCRPGGPD